MTNKEKVKQISQKILQERGASSKEKALSSQEIFQIFRKKYGSEKIPENTVIQYLSKLAQEADSTITTEGRKQGYYLSSKVETYVLEKNEPEQKPRGGERALYPIFKNWLLGQEYRVDETENIKSLRKWGNPDITGIRLKPTLVGTDLEIVTIEVKRSPKDWEQWIFQAVSHRRFANRSYFAFAATDDLLPKLQSAMRYYNDLYHVGILVLLLEDEMFEGLERGTNGDLAEGKTNELFSAPYSIIQRAYQQEFLNALGITSKDQLHTWGEGLEPEE